MLGKRFASSILSLLMLAALWPPFALGQQSQEEFTDMVGTYSIDDTVPAYRDYIQSQPFHRPAEGFVIQGTDFSRYLEDGLETEPVILQDYEGMPGGSLRTEENALVEYTFTVAQTGFYDIVFEYYPIEGKSAQIKRSLFLDGVLPYNEMALLELYRIWSNEAKLSADHGAEPSWVRDNQGNDLKPSMKEAPEWISTYLYDSDGYVTRPLSLHLTAGEHTISILSQREPLLLRRIVFGNETQTRPYSEQKSIWDQEGATVTGGIVRKVEAEHAAITSSQMLYPAQDQTSVHLSPSSARYLLNNTMGGQSWRDSGQWIEWDIDVPADGYYNITLHVNQNFKKGMYVSRKFTIDGVTPFTEMEDYGFTYNAAWRMETLTDSEGEPYLFYLTAGRHSLRMEAVLGEFSGIIDTVRDSIFKLNAIYRKVISLTGVSPDEFQDYQIESSIPELNGEMVVVRDRLTWAIDELRRVAGRASDRERVLITMRDQLNELIRDGERYAKVLGSFKINIRACGTWLNDAIQQQLSLDALYIHSPDTVPERGNESFGSGLWYELGRLFYSFIIDYNQVGNVVTDGESERVTLWIGSGRDQANIIKSMIEEDFTPRSNVNVNVMLVDMGTLLQATLAGQGPDVAIQVGMDMPMNYGLRNAVMDLTRFDDLEEVQSRFRPSANVPFAFNGATYALPETQSFLMMFYRKDILKEIGLELPQTWDDIKVAMAVLNQNQMEIGMLPGEQVFSMFLYQNDGQYYNENGSRCLLDDTEAINAFRLYCEFYTDYKLDKETSVEERFRTGEAPIILADYTTYNNLQVSAPDIKGLWGFAPVPGTPKEDGTIDRTVLSAGSACVVMSAAEYPDACWDFIKWWTEAETQTDYGREMESLMGAAARVPTANVEAFQALPWPSVDLTALNEAFGWTLGTPQVPGSYYTFRNVSNAFYKVTTTKITADTNQMSINSVLKESPREALMDNVILINDEIRYKRTEFGLPLE